MVLDLKFDHINMVLSELLNLGSSILRLGIADQADQLLMTIEVRCTLIFRARSVSILQVLGKDELATSAW